MGHLARKGNKTNMRWLKQSHGTLFDVLSAFCPERRLQWVAGTSFTMKPRKQIMHSFKKQRMQNKRIE